MNRTVLRVTSLSTNARVWRIGIKRNQTNQPIQHVNTAKFRRVKKLEHIMKTSKPRKRARVVESDDEEDLEDPSKQGRSLIEGLTWMLEFL
ncbi:hypothetical protein Tco_0121690 [Tanacetum coccineum]